MKKRVIYITLFLLFITGAAMAESTYLFPWRGESHHYTAKVTDTGMDNPVRWYVCTDEAGTTKAVHGTDYTFVTPGYIGGSVNRFEGIAIYDVEITWGTTVADATNFYVYFEVAVDNSTCFNRMALHVQIAADFNAVAYNVTTASDPVTSTTKVDESCPADPENPIWDGSGHTDIGFSELIYRVEREFSVLAWQFDYKLWEATSQLYTIENIRMVDEGGTELYNGTLQTGTIPVASTENYVFVYVKITNQQDIELKMNIDLDGASLTKDADDNSDSNQDDNNAVHTILPMPEITGFGGN